MKQTILSLTLFAAGICTLTASPAASADTHFFSADLELYGTPEGPGEPFPLPFYPFSGPHQFVGGPWYSGTGVYNLNDSLFDAGFSEIGLNTNNGGNWVESRGAIVFSLTTLTDYRLSGFITDTLSNQPVAAEVLGAIYQVDPSNNNATHLFTVVADGTLSTTDSLDITKSGQLGAGKYEFRYSAFITTNDTSTIASAAGDIRLDLGTLGQPGSETPLPTVATAGVALFGAMTLRRPRRH